MTFILRYSRAYCFIVVFSLACLGCINAYHCPMPTCKECISLETYEAPGLGFDLGVSYGTVVAHMYDGSIVNIAKVRASLEYIQLMHRLNGAPLPDPQSRYQKYRRLLNKKLGYPATPDVGVLSSLIGDLYKEAQSALSSYRLDKVVVTAPHLLALTQEDFNDAIEYAGLRSWLIYVIPYPRIISESRALFAANGNGLCKNYKKYYSCSDEESELPSHTVYSITFTNQALYTTLSSFKSAFGYTLRSEAYLLDYNSGLDSLSNYTSPSGYWKNIRTQLHALPKKSSKPITKVLLAGESVGDIRFLDVLKDSLSEFTEQFTQREIDINEGDEQKTKVDEELEVDMLADPVYAAARGAALYARRRQEVIYDCQEAARCADERQRERDRGTFKKVELR